MDDCLVYILESHPHRVTNIKCRIDTVIFLDDGHIVARNMYRKETNILKKLYTKLVLFTRLYKDECSIKHKNVCGVSKIKQHKKYFDVLLTVHLSIILVINQLNAQNLVL